MARSVGSSLKTDGLPRERGPVALVQSSSTYISSSSNDSTILVLVGDGMRMACPSLVTILSMCWTVMRVISWKSQAVAISRMSFQSCWVYYPS